MTPKQARDKANASRTHEHYSAWTSDAWPGDTVVDGVGHVWRKTGLDTWEKVPGTPVAKVA